MNITSAINKDNHDILFMEQGVGCSQGEWAQVEEEEAFLQADPEDEGLGDLFIHMHVYIHTHIHACMHTYRFTCICTYICVLWFMI